METEKKYFFVDSSSGEIVGPKSLRELAKFQSENNISWDTLVAEEGTEDWMPFDEVLRSFKTSRLDSVTAEKAAAVTQLKRPRSEKKVPPPVPSTKAKPLPPTSAWSVCLYILGVLTVISGIRLLYEEGGALIGWICIGAALQLFIVGHLINVFVAMHFYLKGIYEK